MVIFEKPKGKKGEKQITTVVWPTGFSLLPEEGGVDTQNYHTMRLLNAFLNGERAGVARNMAKKAN